MTNILSFEDYYDDYAIGQHGKAKAQFGSSGKHTSNPTAVCVRFNTPSNREEEVGFYAGDSMGMGGDRVLVVSSEPFATKENADIVGYEEYLNGIPIGKRISCFVNVSGEDPKPVKVRDKTHDGQEHEVDRTTWLKPGATYYFHLYRTDLLESGAHAPLYVEVNGSDSGDQSAVVGQVMIGGIEYIPA